MKYSKYAFITVFVCVCSMGSTQQEDYRDSKQHPELSKLVRNWAQKLGMELWHFGEMVTRKNRVRDSFKDTTIETENGEKILNDIHERISNMMAQKVRAIERIMDVAEHTAQGYVFNNDTQYKFYDMKNLTNSLNDSGPDSNDEPYEDPSIQELRSGNKPYVSDHGYNGKYSSMLNPEESEGYQQDQDSPENVLEKIPEMQVEGSNHSAQDPQASQKQIDKYSMPLYKNRHFYNIPVNTNYSAVHVPINVYERSEEVISGIIWSEELDETFKNNYKEDPTLSWQYFGSSTGFMRQFPAMVWSHDETNPDLFDCRTRTWYIEAASSPKDIIILVDRSGSMKGMRKEIARHVVYNILDTLGNNDYVNIYTFSNTTDALVPCFDNALVQANLANIRVLKESMYHFPTEQIANFSKALITAFELLEEYRGGNKGAKCNQAIMLITDGSQYNFKEIFEEYNWRDLPFKPVRVFTYLIGQEVSMSDTREVKWMACANQGYYTHLKTYAEVREEVLHYIPVMARPMVLNATFKPNPAWSPVYADVTDPKLTNWLWVLRERTKQREKYLMYSKYNKYNHMLNVEDIDKKFVQQQKYKQDSPGETQVYHLMTSVSLPVYDRNPTQERVANLLGVAGTDVPVEYIKTLMDPFRLGVNAYAFLVTNNGYILAHPDLRPVLQGILKPAYNRVDLMEVEILDDDSPPRKFSTELQEFRLRIIHQETGNVTFRVKSHLDNMQRIILMNRQYFYKGLLGTPFTLVVALPQKYGFNRVQHHINNDIHRMRSLDGSQFLKYFTGNWSIHPEWHYCRYYHDVQYFGTAEEEFIHFLKKINGTSWAWTKRDSYLCERKLVSDVVADAKITSWFSENITTSTKEDNGAELIKNLGIVVAFMATHSGLTRWQNFPQNIDHHVHEKHFHRIHNKAIDEIWYKRAVAYHYVEPNNFVYSVPHEIGDANNTLVTVSHAIFRGGEDRQTDKKAPAAVVGYQLYHSALVRLFQKITHSCGDLIKDCKKTCASEELHCLMLDDNGYVIVSDKPEQTGYFFGSLRPDIMKMLQEEGIYDVHRMYDYQGLCPVEQESNNPAGRMPTPLLILTSFFEWAMATLVFFAEVLAGNHVPHHMRYDPSELLYTEHDAVEPKEPVIVSDESGTLEEGGENGENGENDENGNHDEDHYDDTGNEKPFHEAATMVKTKPEPCDNEVYIYKLVHYSERNISSSGYNKTMGNCSRPFIVQAVTWSNMIFLVINNLCQDRAETIPTWEPKEIDYNMSLACYLNQIEPPRRLYFSCINRHENENNITICGFGTNISSNRHLTLFLGILSILKFFNTS